MRAFILIIDLHQRQMTYDLTSRRTDKRQASEMTSSDKPAATSGRASGSSGAGLSLAVIDDEIDELEDEVNGNKRIALENESDDAENLTEE